MGLCLKQKNLTWILLILSIIFLDSSDSKAEWSLISDSRYTSARSSSAGNNGIALGDDVASGLFYNPAILGKLRKNEYEFLNLSSYVNSGVISLFTPLNSVQLLNLKNYAPYLDKKPGNYSDFGYSLCPTIGFAGLDSLPSFSFGLLLQSQTAAKSNGNATYTYRSLYQLIPTFGLGFKWFNGLIRFGYSFQWINEAVGTNTVQSSSLDSYHSNLQQGSSFSHNLGLALTLPTRALPSWNVVVRNISNTTYTKNTLMSFTDASSGTPTGEPMTIDTSMSLQRKMGKGALATWITQFRDLTNKSQLSWVDHLSVGLELSFSNYIYLRGGVGNRYPSVGVGFKQRNSEISMSWFSEELGTSDQRERDVKYMLQYQIRSF